MLRLRLAPLLALLMVGCVAVESDALVDPMEYGCDDVVVIGRVSVLAETPTDSSGDLLGHSVWDLEIKIKRVLRGRERRMVIPAVGVSHAQIRGDLDLIIVLSKPETGNAYRIRTLNVWESGIRLAEKCTAKPA